MRRAELLREAQQAEVVDVHLGARGSVPRRVAMPKARWTSALLTRMSTLPPISPASSRTDLRVGDVERHQRTCGSVARSSKPGSFFHGSAMADPDDVGAGLRRALHQRLADRGLAVGDQHLAELRVAGHFAQLPVVCHVYGLLVREARPAPPGRRGRACARHRARGAVGTSPCRCATTRRPAVELHQAEPPRQRARGRTDRCCDAACVSRKQLPSRPLRLPRSSAVRKAAAGRPRAAGTAPCRSPGTAAARSGRAPRRR